MQASIQTNMPLIGRLSYDWLKRSMDVVGACVAIVLFVPLFAFCAVRVMLADPRTPVIYTQVRMGQHGRPFTMYKLRTMRCDAEAGGCETLASRRDPRVLSCCRWMRRSHIDELPQLINVLRGEMSLVGPRPERPGRHEQLTRHMPEFQRRLVVKPGLTGLAQLCNGYDTDIESVRRKLNFDLSYISGMNVWLDLKLLVATTTRFYNGR